MYFASLTNEVTAINQEIKSFYQLFPLDSVQLWTSLHLLCHT